MAPIGQPGPLSERFMFETYRYLVIQGALSLGEAAGCLEASRRAHTPLRTGEWRQIGHLHESELAIESLPDHPLVLPKVWALLSDYFVTYSLRPHAQ
jgi:hypothetical protein